ncbi:MAG: M48 family metallopeptidase [Pseudomonadales bacterium]|nr:M48 family metallopeptidase [Pseudomonadales bacterium]
MVYNIIRSHRKTLAIHVRFPDIEVRAPFSATDKQVHNFILKKSSWIEDKLLIQSNKHDERFEISNNRLISYMGQAKRIHCQEAAKHTVTLSENSINIHGPNLDHSKQRSLFESWLKTQAQDILIPRTHALIQKLSIAEKLSSTKLRKTKSKWGHCTSQGVIQYNWLILMAPNHVINYLVAHEVCHLIHLNHSKHFWGLVDEVHPGSIESKAWLKDHGHKLWLM